MPQDLESPFAAHYRRWTPADVAPILEGIARSSDSRTLSFSSTDVRVRTDTYNCGCVASDVAGWAPCRRPLHVTIADGAATSTEAKEFVHLRGQFQAILRRAWEIRGRSDPEFAGDIRMTHGIGIDAFAARHDLVLESIFQRDGSLHASLTHVPGAAGLRLTDAGADGQPRLVLQLLTATAECGEPSAVDLGGMPLDESLRACALERVRR